MANVMMYFKPTCPYCVKAQALLSSLGQNFSSIDIAAQPEKRAEMIEKSNGATTVPQIFINDAHVGGCDELHALHRAGKLSPLLS